MKNNKFKNIKDTLMKIPAIKDDVLYRKYGNNIYGLNLGDKIETAVADKLIKARDLGVPFCVMFGNPAIFDGWDPYKNGKWNPPRDYITTEDIATDDNNREIERQNVFAFLRGEEVVRNSEKGKEL